MKTQSSKRLTEEFPHDSAQDQASQKAGRADEIGGQGKAYFIGRIEQESRRYGKNEKEADGYRTCITAALLCKRIETLLPDKAFAWGELGNPDQNAGLAYRTQDSLGPKKHAQVGWGAHDVRQDRADSAEGIHSIWDHPITRGVEGCRS